MNGVPVKSEGADRRAAARDLASYVPFLKALANPTRAQIIEFLLGGERCVCEMTGPLDISQPLVSHHLALLREAGLIRMRSAGTRTYYSIDWERFDTALAGFVGAVESLRSDAVAPDVDPCAAAGQTCTRKA